MVPKVILFVIISFFTSDASHLADTILTDPNFPIVYNLSLQLLSTGFNAGTGYDQIWIRDTNTFLELAAKVVNTTVIKEVLIQFFNYQYQNGGIVDNYNSKGETGKNTVETDQESSLVQAVHTYIKVTGDKSILSQIVNEKSVIDRIEDAFQFLLNERYSQHYGLIWGATSVDWGDVQPEDNPGIVYDNKSHPAIDIYDNAMFVIAIKNYLDMLDSDSPRYKEWTEKHQNITNNIRKFLWDGKKFIPHIYLEKGSPFPSGFDESTLYYHGGTAVAVLAGILTKEEIQLSYKTMLNNVYSTGAQSIGLTLYPPYPDYWANELLTTWSYQNGGDWTWFGARMIIGLIENGFIAEAYQAIQPMVLREIKTNCGFNEWYSVEGIPSGSSQYRGTAGVLGKAISLLKEWAQLYSK